MFVLEAQFVHQAADGTVLIVAVLFQTGASNPTLAKLPWALGLVD